ncbi:MAG: transcription antitermination factor NusB [Litorimonas sp.]
MSDTAPHTKKSRGANPKLRRAARMAVIQALYQMELSNEPSKIVIRQFLDHRFGHEDEPDMVRVDEGFFENVALGTVEFQDEIDAKITEKLSDKWPLRRLNMTLRALLRAASYEILHRPDIPALVIISEYVTLADQFFDGKEPAMANGILDAIAKSVRPVEFGVIDG